MARAGHRHLETQFTQSSQLPSPANRTVVGRTYFVRDHSEKGSGVCYFPLDWEPNSKDYREYFADPVLDSFGWAKVGLCNSAGFYLGLGIASIHSKGWTVLYVQADAANSSLCR